MAQSDELAKGAWRYLTDERRLKPETIERFKLGLNPGWIQFHAPLPGSDNPCTLPPGILIPWQAGPYGIAGANVRTFHKPLAAKYLMPTGSRRRWVYPHDRQWLDWSGPVLIVEGEFDCMIGNQELSNLLPVMTLGGSSCSPEDTRSATRLGGASHLLIATDSDDAGQDCRDMWQDFSPRRAKPISLPEGAKDLTEAVQAGHDLAVWLGHVCEGLGIDLRAWPGLVWEKPLGILRGRLLEPLPPAL